MDSPLSKFLPDNFDASAKIAILAGKGEYPIMLKKRLVLRCADSVFSSGDVEF